MTDDDLYKRMAAMMPLCRASRIRDLCTRHMMMAMKSRRKASPWQACTNTISLPVRLVAVCTLPASKVT